MLKHFNPEKLFINRFLPSNINVFYFLKRLQI